MQKENMILDLSFEFALSIVSFSEQLESSKKFAVANQIIKSGTSIGANIREAQSAESKTDFIHKLKVAAKEAEETEYWLLICKHSTNYPNADELLEKLNSLKKLLSKIISSSKSSLANQHISKSTHQKN
jgi:four helix bundle protein